MKIEISKKIGLTSYELGFKTLKSVKITIDLEKFYIFRGFFTDLGSIPRAFRFIFPRFGLETDAYIVHDYGYRKQPRDKKRKFWDLVLLELLENFGVTYLKRYSIYWGLRSFGWIAWNKNKRGG